MSTPRNLSERYELGETLGFGGMSEVHSGRDLRLDRDVAVKVLRADLARDPSFYLRFRREAQNAAALNHPAIVAVYDTGEAEADDGPLPYIVMERVEGETLRDMLLNDGPFHPRRAMEIMGDVCAALDFSHRHGIIHRDVKPANIMINRAGAVKVMDFGIARAIADGTSTMTQTAAVIGTAQYLSPEQARGEQVDARSDVYAAGCVLFELLTGEPPFTGDSPVAVAYQHVREDPRTPSSVNAAVPPELDSVVLKAMSKNPANRYSSAGEMRSDVVRVLAGQRPSAPAVMTEDDRTQIMGESAVLAPPGKHRSGGGAEPATEEEQGPEPARRTGLVVAASLLGLAFVGLVAWFLVEAFTTDEPLAPTLVAVPDLVGQSSAEAQNQLNAQNLRPEVQDQFSDEQERGDVVSTDPASGKVEVGSKVILYVSSGPEQVEVPRLENLTQAQAEADLTEIGLVAELEAEPQPSDTVAAGSVISASPDRGLSVDKGSTVTLTLSSGLAPVPVPTVVGLTQEAATSNLRDAGFEVVAARADSAEAEGQVVAQNPPGGQRIPKGSPVTVDVSSGNRIVMPDLVGLPVDQVLDALERNNYQGGRGNITPEQVPVADPAQVNVVTGQSVEVGAEIETSTPISIQVGASQALQPTTTSPAIPTGTTAPPSSTP